MGLSKKTCGIHILNWNEFICNFSFLFYFFFLSFNYLSFKTVNVVNFNLKCTESSITYLILLLTKISVFDSQTLGYRLLIICTHINIKLIECEILINIALKKKYIYIYKC